MAHTNIAGNIISRLKSILTGAIANVTVKNVYRLPGEDTPIDFFGKYRRAILFKLENEIWAGEASDSWNERSYNFTVQCWVSDTGGGQDTITDLAEQVKYHLHQNKVDSNSNWHHLRIDPTEYPDETLPTNIKKCQFNLRVDHGGTE